MIFTTGIIAIDVLLSISILVGVFSIGAMVGFEMGFDKARKLSDPDYSGGL